MADVLGPGAASASPVLSTTADVTSPASGDTFFQDCTAGVAGTGTPLVSKWLNKLMQQMRRVIRAAGVTLDNTDDDMLGKALQSGYFNWAGTFGGTANALTATLNPSPASILAGTTLRGKTPSNNSGATTLNGYAVVNVAGAALSGGELFAGGHAEFLFNVDGKWTLTTSLPGVTSAYVNAQIAAAIPTSTGALPIGATLTSVSISLSTGASAVGVGTTSTTTSGRLDNIVSNSTFLPAGQVWKVVASVAIQVLSYVTDGSGRTPWLISTTYVRIS